MTTKGEICVPPPPPAQINSCWIRNPSDVASISPSTARADYATALENVEESHYEITDIVGSIPPHLEGTLFRNGPAMFKIGNMKEPCHPVDGDGMISRVSFSNGRAFFRSSFVKTEGFLRQQKAGKMVQKGACGTKVEASTIFEDWFKNIPLVGLLGLDFSSTDFKNTSNTNTCMFPSRDKHRLLTLWEGGLPYEMDPETLETIGETSLGETLDRGDAFSAHASIDYNHPDGPRLLNIGLSNTLRTSVSGSPLILWEFDANGFLAIKHELKSKHNHWVIHDFTFTTNYFVVVQSPSTMDFVGLAMGKGFQDFIRDDPNGIVWVYIVPRRPSKVSHDGINRGEVRMFQTSRAFIYHHVNAFEDENGDVILDSMVFPELYPLEPHKLQDWSKQQKG
jgi:all-trans-8'-apo-beta-carotenal 15,15'-oxygenase